MKDQALRGLLLSGLIATCLTIFETNQSLPLAAKSLAQKSQSDTVDGHQIRTPAAVTKACALYYEREEHPFWSRLKRIYKGHEEVVLIPLAKPSDIVKCVLDHNPEEILIFARPLQGDSENTRLSFLIPLNEDETFQNYRKTLTSLRRQHQRIVSQKNFSYCDSGYGKDASCSEPQRQELKIRRTLSKLSSLKTTDPTLKMAFGYEKGVLPQEPFENLYGLVKTSNLRLKKIRVSSSQPQRIMESYPGLQRMVREQGIRLLKTPALPE